jgi:hypothetical protein
MRILHAHVSSFKAAYEVKKMVKHTNLNSISPQKHWVKVATIGVTYMLLGRGGEGFGERQRRAKS